LAQHGVAYPGEHDAIIDADLWSSVETILAASRKRLDFPQTRHARGRSVR